MSDWRDWRLRCGDTTWRIALPEDAQAIEDIIDATEQHLKHDQDRPDPFSPPVILTLVAERDGEVVDALVVELMADIRKLGLDREAMRAYPALLPVLGGFLAERGVRMAHMSTARRWLKVMKETLRALGFSPSERNHWFRKVRP